MTVKRLLVATGVFLISVAGCGRSDSKVKNVFGADDRQLITTRAYPFSALAKLDDGCSGALIGHGLLLTAAHCVIDPTTQTARSNFRKVTIDVIGGHGSDEATPVRAWIGTNQPEQDRKSDWAIVLLSRRLGDLQGSLGVYARDFEHSMTEPVSLMGYSSDMNAGQTGSVHWNCHVQKVSEGRLFHDCDATAGISGGPIFQQTIDGFKVVAISVSEFRHDQPAPIHRDQWTEEFTNVGVPATAFVDVVEKLQSTVDGGGQEPIIDHATVVEFGAQPQPQPQPQVDLPFAQMADGVSLWQRIAQIDAAHGALLQDADQVEALARRVDITELTFSLNYYRQSVRRDMREWSSFAEACRNGLAASYDRRDLYSGYLEMTRGKRDLERVADDLPADVSQDLRVLLTQIAQHVHAAEALIFSP